MVMSMSSAYWEKLQGDSVPIAEALDLFTPGGNFYWTTQNDNVTMNNHSGDLTEYSPFPGQPVGGLRKSIDLAIETVKFVMANSGGVFDSLILGKELGKSTLVMRRYFTDTPGLGATEFARGSLGDFVWNRDEITGQIRDDTGSAKQKWPYYNFQDGCIWKFGSTPCGVNTSSLTITLSLDVSSSTQIKIACVSGSLTQSYENGYFTFGKFTATAGVNSGQVRTIRAHSGDVLELSHQYGGVVSSLSATLFPGCRKRRIADCTSKYDNVHNGVFFEWIPIQEDAF